MQDATKTSRAPRVVLVIILLGFVLQLTVAHFWGEPYPGVFQPRFAEVAAGGTAVVREPSVIASYSDGSTATFTHLDVMSDSKSLPIAFFRSAFGPDSDLRESPSTKAWLAGRLSDLHGGGTPEKAVIEWREMTYPLDGQQPAAARTVDRYVVSFEGGHD